MLIGVLNHDIGIFALKSRQQIFKKKNMTFKYSQKTLKKKQLKVIYF